MFFVFLLLFVFVVSLSAVHPVILEHFHLEYPSVGQMKGGV